MFVGVAWLLFTMAYSGGTINFFSIVFTGSSYENILLFSILNVNFAPIIVAAWFYAMLELFYSNYKYVKPILMFLLIACFLIETFVIYFEATNQFSLLGFMQTPFQYSYTLPLKIFTAGCVGITLLIGFFISFKSRKVNDIAIQLKGKYLLLAFTLLTVSTFLDAVISIINPLFTMIAKILLIIDGIAFYIGYFLPSWIRKYYPELKDKK